MSDEPDAPEPWLVLAGAVVLVLLWLSGAVGAEPSADEAARAAVAVELAKLKLRTDPAPDGHDPTAPAPPGFRWVRYPGEPWKLERVAAAPPVYAPPPVPFGYAPAACPPGG